MATTEAPCFTMIWDDASEIPSTQELRSALEKGSDEVKQETLKKIILATLNGSPQPALLMPIIQFVLPSRNKALKKLLHFYWEVCPKHDENGKLKQEMILVCNAIRNDLQHPNEYIRGATLRFLQKITDPELLEPLIPTCRSCLEHRHSYVRKNAVFAVYTIYRDFEHLLPDAPDLIQTFLAAESDSICKRNAFVFLVNCAMPKAVEYVLSVYDQISGFDELLQLSIIDLLRKDSIGDSAHRPRYIRCILELLNASSHTVKYEAATTLTTLTQNPVAIKAAASCFIELVAKESDNNVKLIVLDRLDALRSKHEHVLDGLVMDIVRVVASSDMEVRRKALAIALPMISARNVEEVVTFLKNQLVKTRDEEQEKAAEYRQLLIQSIHVCAIRFSEVASSVVHALMEFLGDANSSSATDVIGFVREVVEKFPELRQSITERLLEHLSSIKAGKVFRGALWIVGEYCTEEQDILAAFEEIRKVIGEIPILAAEQLLLESADTTEEGPKDDRPINRTRVLEDGTYATETIYSTSANAEKLAAVKSAAKPALRALILSGDYYTGAVLAATLTKLLLRLSKISADVQALNGFRAEAMLIMISIIRVGQSEFVTMPIDEDSQDRILQCVQSLSELDGQPAVEEIFLHDTKAAYAQMVSNEEKKAAEKKEKETKVVAIQVDDLISFRQLVKKGSLQVDEFEQDVNRATGSGTVQESVTSNLKKIHQLTGFTDPIYAEAYVKIHGFDILLDVLLVNQTSDTMQNLCLDFSTLGDLKLVERPSTHTIGPHGFLSVKATIKVSSTETGVIFGNILWEGPNLTENCVILSDMHIDIMDYIKPSSCNEAQFRSMWTEFEWENRVNVVTTMTDLHSYLQHIMKSTNMACLTPDAAMSGECDFLSANLCARSVFGEDALANISVEKTEDGTIVGHVRIRSKTQGIALSLGDKITQAQKREAIPLA
ncbi:coatomer protein [Sistotremastrum niveocremeum HHB9708]|uniref:Coatomer subunit beta n=1 Tax=Sistotremastrum niveocremeum HHB9708 TaxID=1314777 RepID=A0A164UL40_9AGAM|nr:coatomer protein [Sistotremastrum niveocremeum HHB9708]